MKTLTDRLNFSTTETSDNAIHVRITEQLSCYDTLTLQCHNNNIDIDKISDSDFDSAVIVMENFDDNCEEGYNFWID